MRCCAKIIEEGGGACRAHAEKEKLRELQRDTEARLLDRALGRRGKDDRQKKRLKRGAYAEEAIEATGDTVVVWSLRAYLATPAFSLDHLEAQRRSAKLPRGDTPAPRAKESAPSRAGARRALRAAHGSLADFVAHLAARRGAVLDSGSAGEAQSRT